MTDRGDLRMGRIRSRTRQYRQRYERQALSRLTVCCLLLLAGIAVLLKEVQSPGVSAVADGYGAVLLRDSAGGYITIGIAAFVIGVVLTVACIRYRTQKQLRSKSAEEREE